MRIMLCALVPLCFLAAQAQAQVKEMNGRVIVAGTCAKAEKTEKMLADRYPTMRFRQGVKCDEVVIVPNKSVMFKRSGAPHDAVEFEGSTDAEGQLVVSKVSFGLTGGANKVEQGFCYRVPDDKIVYAMECTAIYADRGDFAAVSVLFQGNERN